MHEKRSRRQVIRAGHEAGIRPLADAAMPCGELRMVMVVHANAPGESVTEMRMRWPYCRRGTSGIRTNRNTQGRDSMLTKKKITSLPHFKYQWECMRTYTK